MLSQQLRYANGTVMLPPVIARKYLLYDLQCRLYTDFYCPGSPKHSEGDVKQVTRRAVTPWLRHLSAANVGDGFYSEGWEVCSVERSQVIVCRAGLKLWAQVRDCLIPRDCSLQPGIRVGLRFPKELPEISPGFYMAMGNRELLRSVQHIIVRLYFNITADGSMSLMRNVTSRLNSADLAFNLKIVSNPGGFDRCDSAVLYIHKADCNRVFELIAEIYPRIARHLKDGTPVFTKELARGFSLAEDPGGNESFGSHRCRVLAEAIIRVFERCGKSLEQRSEIVKECFEENGIDFSRPFLTHPNVDDYNFSAPSSPVTKQKRALAARDQKSAAFLQTAAIIGQLFKEEALWKGTCCNWMDFRHADPLPGTRRVNRDYGALGPDLYSGTAGVALFLSQLCSATRDPNAQDCAVGAINQAFSRLGDVQPKARWSLFTGWLGIAIAGAYIGMVLGENQVRARATRLVRSLIKNTYYSEH
jgi:hypothetical protein